MVSFPRFPEVLEQIYQNSQCPATSGKLNSRETCASKVGASCLSTHSLFTSCREGFFSESHIPSVGGSRQPPPAGPLHTCPPRLSPNHCLFARVVPAPSRIRAVAPKVREPRSNRARRPGPSGSQRQRLALQGLVDRVLPLRELPGRES